MQPSLAEKTYVSYSALEPELTASADLSSSPTRLRGNEMASMVSQARRPVPVEPEEEPELVPQPKEPEESVAIDIEDPAPEDNASAEETETNIVAPVDTTIADPVEPEPVVVADLEAEPSPELEPVVDENHETDPVSDVSDPEPATEDDAAAEETENTIVAPVDTSVTDPVEAEPVLVADPEPEAAPELEPVVDAGPEADPVSDLSDPVTGDTEDSIGGSEPEPQPEANPVPAPAPAATFSHAIEVMGGRVTSLSPPADDVVSVRILSRPEHGHISVNPDMSLALVMTLSEHTGGLAFSYEALHADGSRSLHEISAEVLPGLQEKGWGTSLGNYMLAVGEDNRVEVEHGDNHRKVYVSGSEAALTAADIAAREGVSESTITARWLQNNPHYGASEDLALSTDMGIALWGQINPRGSESSNWLLLERGHEYDAGRVFARGASGESELHPLYIGAWGEGDQPVLTEYQRMFQTQSQNVVVQDIKFGNGAQFLGDSAWKHNNILVDGSSFTGGEVMATGVNGLSFRNSIIYDVWRDTPKETDTETWSAHSKRESGMYVSGADGVLFEGVIFDHNGWAPDFLPDASTDGGHPPSMYSHNLYMQASTSDVTVRDMVSLRGASTGAQLRGGAFVDGAFFADNNIAFNVNGGQSTNPVGNYSLILGALVTQAAYRGEGLPNIGALDWGVRNEARLTTLIESIVAHAGDPNDPEDITLGRSAVHQTHTDGAAYDDTIIWRWGNTAVNVEGLDPEALNQITIQLYTAALLGKPDATVDDFATYMRGLQPTEYAAAVQDVQAFFRAGFGIATETRAEAATLRFVPDDRADGVRWDNRLNWDSGDLPGKAAGDSVDLGGNAVVFGGTVALQDLHFGDAGRLIVNHGRLTVDGALTVGAEGAALEVARAGQVWTNGFDRGGLLDITVEGGRFVNTGAFLGPVDLSASGGQTVLASSGAVFAVSGDSRVEIVGTGAKVGFDGADGGMALLGFEMGAALAFVADASGLGEIATFRTGAFGDAPAVRTGIDLGGVALEIDLSNFEAATGNIRLLDADELVGNFGSVNVMGLAGRDARILIDYDTDAVWLQLSEGSGETMLDTFGTEDMVDHGYEDVWQALMQGAAQGQVEAWDL